MKDSVAGVDGGVLVEMPLADDFHIHLREGLMMEAVCPAVRQGGCSRVLVMPNTVKPISTCHEALGYRDKLMKIDDNVQYLMTLYLGPWIGVDDLRANAAACGVIGVKSYPKGVTTNSACGVESYEPFYEVFSQMEKLGLSLHLHGEVPGLSPLTAEAAFLPHLHELSVKFPSLRIVLEHVTTKEAVEAVKKLANVAGSVTAHHLELTTNDVMSKDSNTASAAVITSPHNYCKPLAKSSADRDAIRQVVAEGHPRFFLGSDSAPHPMSCPSELKRRTATLPRQLVLRVSSLRLI